MPVDWEGYERLDFMFATAADVDAMPLMERFCDIILEGSRRGILSGVDGNDVPMPALKYRFGIGKSTKNRRVPHYGTTLFDTTELGFDDNLTTAQYQEFSGPRLAPRGEASRVIKNLHTAIEFDPGTKTWWAIAAWHNVVSKKGIPFLGAHFNGLIKNTAPYDLRPVRPKDMQFALNASRAFAKDVFFANF